MTGWLAGWEWWSTARSGHATLLPSFVRLFGRSVVVVAIVVVLSSSSSSPSSFVRSFDCSLVVVRSWWSTAGSSHAVAVVRSFVRPFVRSFVRSLWRCGDRRGVVVIVVVRSIVRSIIRTLVVRSLVVVRCRREASVVDVVEGHKS